MQAAAAGRALRRRKRAARDRPPCLPRGTTTPSATQRRRAFASSYDTSCHRERARHVEAEEPTPTRTSQRATRRSFPDPTISTDSIPHLLLTILSTCYGPAHATKPGCGRRRARAISGFRRIDCRQSSSRHDLEHRAPLHSHRLFRFVPDKRSFVWRSSTCVSQSSATGSCASMAGETRLAPWSDVLLSALDRHLTDGDLHRTPRGDPDSQPRWPASRDVSATCAPSNEMATRPYEAALAFISRGF